MTEQGGDQQEMHEAVHEALKARFLPEFLNRIDDIVVFQPLERDEIRKIVGLQMESLAEGLRDNGLQLVVTEAAIDRIAATGYDPSYGARPIKRVIQREIQNPMASALLRESYEEGSTVYVDFAGERFTFNDRPPEPVRRVG